MVNNLGKRLIDILGISQGDLEKRLIATDGKQGKSPFEDPSIVRPSKINNLYERLGLRSLPKRSIALSFYTFVRVTLNC